jgi:serine/threonine protein kinase
MPAELPPNAAEMLEGKELAGDWVVGTKIPRSVAATGGNFCVGYLVSNLDGRHGFLKALNYVMALNSNDPAETLRRLTESYTFERDLLRHCGDSRMSHVVVSLADGVVRIDGCPIPTVNYIIFELADRDVRAELDRNKDLDALVKLRSLHHVAVGLRQLHQKRIAHQDVKPSNVLMFTKPLLGQISKVSDLGRATDASRPADHDEFCIAGDPSYAPPEQLYGWTLEDFGPRRLACDLYQLGSLAAFMFTGATMNTLLNMELMPEHNWCNWQGSYNGVLPYVRDAFGRALINFTLAVPCQIEAEMVSLVSYLCDPDPLLRGHPISRRSAGNQYGLDRIISHFDLMVHRVRLQPKLASR